MKSKIGGTILTAIGFYVIYQGITITKVLLNFGLIYIFINPLAPPQYVLPKVQLLMKLTFLLAAIVAGSGLVSSGINSIQQPKLITSVHILLGIFTLILSFDIISRIISMGIITNDFISILILFEIIFIIYTGGIMVELGLTWSKQKRKKGIVIKVSKEEIEKILENSKNKK